ncbi:MBL fold metallo-hydrolase [Limnobacter humi]|uniref:MBL fold metallo-hydrolase n=1 Tax=Limnobacter humi TaxID=1778671 RepID=A0ABT1WFM7_9BURK|nr:MBL fold metallo-hydrolase [Limnobacter humi]MCQ8896174.1 MBL fold metallo-hydrolase [Limnobacter humi]
MIKKISWALLGIVLVGGAVAYTQRLAITGKIVERMVGERMADPLTGLVDGLHVGLCGTGSPFPDPQRGAPCTLVIAGKRVFLFDAGSGSAKQISRMKFSTGQIQSVFLTHFHSDHIDGLGEIMMTRWAQTTGDERLTVIGPTGVEQVVKGFEEAYAHDTQYRIAHHGKATMIPKLAGAEVQSFDAPAQGVIPVYQDENTTIEAFRVDHGPVEPAVGYRIRYKDRSMVISGDTQSSSNLAMVAKDVNLLVHEALSPELVARLEAIAGEHHRDKLQKIFHDIPNYHTSPEEIAKLATQAGVQSVVLSHIVPPLPLPPMKELFLGKAPEIFTGPLRIGEDGDLIHLPTGSSQIQFERRWQ